MLPQAASLRCHLSASGRRCRQNRGVRITYDPEINAAYIHLTDQELPGHHTTTKAPAPPGVKAWIALDWNAERLIGIEVLDANAFLPTDLLDQAETPH